MTPTIASLPGGTSPVAFPVLLLLGWYFLENDIARLLCLVLTIVWLVCYTTAAVWNARWELLIFPSLVLVSWSIIARIDKSFS